MSADQARGASDFVASLALVAKTMLAAKTMRRALKWLRRPVGRSARRQSFYAQQKARRSVK